ncbi:cytochrome P450 [Nocardia aobensis]|uniref:cytochrome P450 n=1 Tax=Nocardia aobensis TaxID=257277 RepID=UPI0005633723|nr:cytochrome P450 [Nocardia aobensis]
MSRTEASAQDLHPEFPVERTCPYTLPERFELLRAHGPVSKSSLFDGRVIWAVTGHAEARKLLTDPRIVSSRRYENLAFPVPIPALTALDGERPVRSPLISTDPPEHGNRRRIFTPYLTARKIDALRPSIEEVVSNRLTALLEEGPGVDLHRVFALPIPSIVICRFLGVPYEDHDYFEELTMRRFDPVDGSSMIDLYDYIDGLVQDKSADRNIHPTGLLDEVIVNHVARGALDKESLTMFALELLIGGHDTTANMITSSVYTLLRHPDQLDAIRADPSRLPAAIEELLRILAIPASLSRVATDDIAMGGQLIKAGDGVLISPIAVNHDAAVFENPERFDIGRPRNRHHVGFGFGRHQCIGQNLARVEMEIALDALITRLPTLQLAIPDNEVPLRQGMLAGVEMLPIEW